VEPTWLGAARVLFVAGKGGVGSSTVAAALSLLAARNGADVLLASVDGKPGLGPLLGGKPLTKQEQLLRTFAASGGRVRARTIPPDQAFGDYLELRGVGGLLRRAASAARYLTSRGVVRIETRGLGETEPVATNETEAGRHQNRRVEIAIYASEATRAAARRQAGGS